MDMKVKSSLIRKYRNEKLWSQEQLAQACGLGLRTIQRLEARGSGSQESIKALAAVFEITTDSLVWPDGTFQVYRNKQWGIVTFTAIFTIMATLLFIYHSFPSLHNSISSIINTASLMGIVFGILTITAVIFSSLTIEVNESEICWFFGFGFFKKSLPLEEVGACKKVKNPIWMGFGIHAYGTGWIYNVSGLLGVEITLKGGSNIRLGTNEPNYLLQAIQDAKDNLN